MAKKKTYGKQRRSSIRLSPHDPTKTLKDPAGVADTLLYCLSINDLESFQDVLIAHLHVASKSKLAKKTKLGRRTLYDLLDRKKKFNPTLSTIGPLLEALRKP